MKDRGKIIVWLIIDGYNVLRSNGGTAPLRGRDFQAERERFIENLGRYLGQRRDKVTVVFDGFNADTDFPAVKRQGGVEVIYSRRSQTADEVIKEMVDQAPDTRDIMVVSSDREISDFVKSLGASVIGARNLADRLGLYLDDKENPHPEEINRATYYERYVKGYLDEEENSPKPRKGKSRRTRRKRSPLNLWRVT